MRQDCVTVQSKNFFAGETYISLFHLNPLTPLPAITSHAKTHPQFPVPAVIGRDKACKDNCLSYMYPPWRYFGPPLVLLLLRTNKPMRMDFLRIFLEEFRGPRKMLFCLKIIRLKSVGNHGTLQAKSTNFQGLVYIPKMEKLLLWHLKWKRNT